MFAFLYNTFYIRPAFLQIRENPASVYPDIHHALMTQRVWIAPVGQKFLHWKHPMQEFPRTGSAIFFCTSNTPMEHCSTQVPHPVHTDGST
jgi:hypothetical protein